MYVSLKAIRQTYKLDTDEEVMEKIKACIVKSKHYILDDYPVSYDLHKQSLHLDAVLWLNSSVSICTDRLLNQYTPLEIEEKFKQYADKVSPLKQYFTLNNTIIKLNAEKLPMQVYATCIMKMKKHNIKDIDNYINRILIR